MAALLNVNTPVPEPPFVKFLPDPLITPLIVTPPAPSIFIIFSVLFPNNTPNAAEPPVLIVKSPALLFLTITLFTLLTEMPLKLITGEVEKVPLLLLINMAVDDAPEIENAPI